MKSKAFTLWVQSISVNGIPSRSLPFITLYIEGKHLPLEVMLIFDDAVSYPFWMKLMYGGLLQHVWSYTKRSEFGRNKN